ncbi:MAG: substrate-binding domain-containing protein, partial [Pseudomonadota bacterium]
DHYPEFQSRYAGLCAALGAQGILHDGALQHDALTRESEGYEAARALIATGEAFDAIFAASDLIAIGAMRALTEAGLRVPHDVAVIGFDDIPAASLANPPLTTIMQDIKGAGERLVETLLAQIEGAPRPDNRLPSRLILRGSTGSA